MFTTLFTDIIKSFVKLVVRHSSFYVISGFENATGNDNTGALAGELQEAGFVVVRGVGKYKGTGEPSLLVADRQGEAFGVADDAVLASLARKYKQESFLRVTVRNGQRTGEFVYSDGRPNEVVGNSIIESEDARANDFYSEFGEFAFYVG